MKYYVDVKCVDCGSLFSSRELENIEKGAITLCSEVCDEENGLKRIHDYECYDHDSNAEYGKIWISSRKANAGKFYDLKEQNELLIKQNKLLEEQNKELAILAKQTHERQEKAIAELKAALFETFKFMRRV